MKLAYARLGSAWMMSLVSVTLTCVLVLALLVPSPSEAQNPPATESQADPIQEANQLNAKGVELYDAGRYPEAEPLIKRALAIWESALGPNHINVAACVDNLARVYSAEGQYAEAEKLQKRALAIQEKALGINSPPVAESLNNLAGDYHSEGRYAEAEPLQTRASDPGAVARARLCRCRGDPQRSSATLPRRGALYRGRAAVQARDQ